MKNLYLPISIIIAGLIIAGSIIFYTQSQKVQQKSAGEPTEKFTIAESDHIKGDPDAPVTLIEYSDFQCPFCAAFHPTIKKVLDDNPGKVRWVYRHFPLDQIHQNARPAAEASECSAEQGKFWEFADLLFENQEKLGENFYKELAARVGINQSQFNECLFSRKYKDKVETDLEEGIKVGVKRTPGSFVNGELVSGAVPYETLKTAVEKALAELK